MRAIRDTCDTCGRSEEAPLPGAVLPEGWGVLVVQGAPPRDVCRGCVAKLGAWGPALDGRVRR